MSKTSKIICIDTRYPDEEKVYEIGDNGKIIMPRQKVRNLIGPNKRKGSKRITPVSGDVKYWYEGEYIIISTEPEKRVGFLGDLESLDIDL